jgi:large subunit ribosomal protein L35
MAWVMFTSARRPLRRGSSLLASIPPIVQAAAAKAVKPLGARSPQILNMQKTKKSVAKRFKLTSTGKLMRRTPGFRHLLRSKSTKSKRRASRDKLVAPGHAAALKRCLPFG